MSYLISAKNKLMCPLVSALIQVFILYMFFFQFFEIKDHYYSSIATAKIKAHIESKINQCGKDYWISWLVLDGNSSKSKYYFQDLIGCNPELSTNGNCAFSVKEAKLNPFYNALHHRLDKCSYKFLSGIPTAEVAFYEDITKLPCTSIKEAVGSSNKTISSLGLTVTKNIKRNIVYVFTMSNTSALPGKCTKRQVVNILTDLSLYAKDNL